MKKRIDLNGISFNIWLYFVIFALAIITILWLFQILILTSSNATMKVQELDRVANLIRNEYEKENFSEEVNRIAFENSLMIIVFRMEGQTPDYLAAATGYEGVQGGGDIQPESLRTFLQQFEQGDKGYYVEQKGDYRTLIYGMVLEKGAEPVYLYMNSSLPAVNITISILRRQLILVTILSALLSFALSIFISLQLSKPIVQMSAAAKQLAKGNYAVRFEGNGFTEIDKLCDTLNYATEELSATDSMRKELIANVSHDLRTPLTIIKSYAEMIRDLSGENKQKREEHLEMIISETDRLSGLVNDLLELSKMQASAEELKLQLFDLSQLVLRVAKHFETIVTEQNYHLTCEVAPQLFVNADEGKIEQVVYNLVSNAVNYTGSDKVVNIRLFETDHATVRFEVQDTGKGISPKEIDQIWDRYYRSAEAHKRVRIGTGLGLNIVKTILEAHNAPYGVNSKVGKGSVFYFELRVSKGTVLQKEDPSDTGAK